MENILAHIQIGNSKDEVGYLIRQTQKYRKRNGKVSRYYSHAYIYNDGGLGYKKLYVRKADVSLVRNKISEDLEKNPDRYTDRAKVAIINKFTGIGM